MHEEYPRWYTPYLFHVPVDRDGTHIEHICPSLHGKAIGDADSPFGFTHAPIRANCWDGYRKQAQLLEEYLGIKVFYITAGDYRHLQFVMGEVKPFFSWDKSCNQLNIIKAGEFARAANAAILPWLNYCQQNNLPAGRNLILPSPMSLDMGVWTFEEGDLLK